MGSKCLSLLLILSSPTVSAFEQNKQKNDDKTIVVISTRTAADADSHIGNVDKLSAEEIKQVSHVHIQELLQKQNEILEKTQNDKHIIVSRLKDYRKDLAVFSKYASPEQIELIEELGLNQLESKSKNSMNPVAQITLDIMTKEKEMTNEDLYHAYTKTLKENELPEKYTFFNIKTRGLYNRGLLIRNKGIEENNSRKDIITLNESK